MARQPDKPAALRLADRGVDVVAGSLDDRAALGAAMRGVDAVFALTTPFEADIDAEVTQGHAILAAAVEAHVPHMVFSSVASADQHTGVPHFESKDVLGEMLGRSVRHDQTPLESIRNPDMFAMWRFLNGPGYRVDVEALRDENPDIAWTSFADWARQSIE